MVLSAWGQSRWNLGGLSVNKGIRGWIVRDGETRWSVRVLRFLVAVWFQMTNEDQRSVGGEVSAFDL